MHLRDVQIAFAAAEPGPVSPAVLIVVGVIYRREDVGAYEAAILAGSAKALFGDLTVSGPSGLPERLECRTLFCARIRENEKHTQDYQAHNQFAHLGSLSRKWAVQVRFEANLCVSCHSTVPRLSFLCDFAYNCYASGRPGPIPRLGGPEVQRAP